MKRLVYLISTFVILTGMYGGSVGAWTWGTYWCGTSSSVFESSVDDCNRNGGIAFTGRDRAQAHHESLGKSSTSSLKLWCATKDSVSRVSKAQCNLWDGKAFPLKFQAQAEHDRLKAASKGWCVTACMFCDLPKKYQLDPNNELRCRAAGGKFFANRSEARAHELKLNKNTPVASSSSSTASSSSSGSGFVWCATDEDVKFVRLSACQSKGGQSFSTDKSRAEAEHKRLKEVLSKSSKYAENVEAIYCHNTPRNLFYRVAGSCGFDSQEISQKEFMVERSAAIEKFTFFAGYDNDSGACWDTDDIGVYKLPSSGCHDGDLTVNSQEECLISMRQNIYEDWLFLRDQYPEHSQYISNAVLDCEKGKLVGFKSVGNLYCHAPENNVWYSTTKPCLAGEETVAKDEYFSLWCIGKDWPEPFQMDAGRCDLMTRNNATVFATKLEAELELLRLNSPSITILKPKNDEGVAVGTLTYFGGGKYVGEIANDVPNGQGTFTFANGDKYVGEHRNSKAHGQGTYTFANGDKYVGENKYNKAHGQGTFTWSNGLQTSGEWKSDDPWNAIHYNQDQTIAGTYTDGKWCAECKPTNQQLALVASISASSPSSSSTASSSGSNKVWCATKDSVTWISKNYCRQEGGESYPYKTQAKAEYKRLNSTSSTASSSSSTAFDPAAKPKWVIRVGIFQIISNARARENLLRESGYPTGNEWVRLGEHEAIRVFVGPFDTKDEAINLESSVAAVTQDKTFVADYYSYTASSSSSSITTQTTQTTTTQPSAVDNTAEIEFWKSIKDQENADMYRAYIDQFPNGVYVVLAKIKLKALGGDTSSVAQSSIPNLDYGDYYALVIGNNRYDYLGDLRTAVNDARSVANLLELDYGFNVTKLENANRDQIISSISGLRSKVTSEDNVLIYYAGHGVLDKDADEGYWLPVDANRDNPVNWVMTDRIVSQVRAMKAKHVMIVADSCFSGTITRGIKIEIKQPTREWLETIVKKKARTALTSGGLEPVMDSGGGNNSVFANSFLSILRDNDGVLDASQLFSQLRPKVMVNSDQTPEYGDIHRAGHDGGDFLFVRQ